MATEPSVQKKHVMNECSDILLKPGLIQCFAQSDPSMLVIVGWLLFWVLFCN